MLRPDRGRSLPFPPPAQPVWRAPESDGQGTPFVPGGTFAAEQQAVNFYSRMMGIMRDQAAKRLRERLVHEELKHKLRLEMFYDDFFYGED